MLQGVLGNSRDGGAESASVPAPSSQHPAQLHGSSGGAGSTSEEGDRSSGGNRWPRQETLALIKIRSDMDVVFRDSSLKSPLWDEVSRKLSELGYHRSAKKCKEKFENVYKYHKRTKEGRTSKADGKTYRFFDQLEALEANPVAGRPPAMPVTVPSVVMPMPFNVTGSHRNNINPISVAAPAVVMPTVNHVGEFSFLGSTDSGSSSSSSDEVSGKRKRKWKDFFGKLMKEVIDKQEEMQMKFLDRIEKRERERMAREEAWRIEEMAKMNREHDLLVQERSIAAAKDAAVITFLQKITEQNPNTINPPPPPPQPMQQQKQQNQPPPPPPIQQQQPPPPIQQQQQPQPLPAPAPSLALVPAPAPAITLPAPVVKNLDNNGGEISNTNTNTNTNTNMNTNTLAPSPSRWPKAEVNTLINLRTRLDIKYQDSAPKGPLWEEISAAMIKLGYNRNAKRCKEKWENINKYYKKVKESSKKRPDDSKTCPYFHQLDAIYREKAKNTTNNNNPALPETTQMAPIMAEPEQQWPLPAMVVHHHQQPQRPMAHKSENTDQNNDNDYDDDEDEDEEEGEGGEYEIVPNKNSSMAAV